MLKPECLTCNAQPCQCATFLAARHAHRLLIESQSGLREKPESVWRYKLATHQAIGRWPGGEE